MDENLNEMNFGENIKILDSLANSTDSLDNLDLIDFAYCYKVRNLYQAYKDNLMTLEQCKEAKEKIKKQYLELNNKILDGYSTYCMYQTNINKASGLRADINKSNDLRQMLNNSLECIALMTGDKTFADVNKRKIEGSAT